MLLVIGKDNTKPKKVLCMLLIFHKNIYITDFKEKSNFLNSFFGNQGSLMPNNSILPCDLKLLTERTLTFFDFSETDILQIIKSQDSNKSHEAICKPLNIILKTFLNTGKFPLQW